MNFLSHYYLDHHDSRPYYTLGLVLPDLMKISNPAWKMTLSRMSNGRSAVSSQINAGVARHFEVDAHWHNSEFFSRYAALAGKHISSEKMDGVKKYAWFLRHILVELMLDRQLVRSAPEICHSFYSQLDKIEKDKAELYLKSLTFVEETEVFFTFFDRFRKYRYLFDYSSRERIIYALGRIFLRVTGKEFSGRDTVILSQCINDMDDKLAQEYQSFFSSLNPKLNRVL